jgi:hypothetical protein
VKKTLLMPPTGLFGEEEQKILSIQYFLLRMFATEHKHPVMPTKNRLREFFVGDACALTCSGMLRKSEDEFSEVF